MMATGVAAARGHWGIGWWMVDLVDLLKAPYEKGLVASLWKPDQIDHLILKIDQPLVDHRPAEGQLRKLNRPIGFEAFIGQTEWANPPSDVAAGSLKSHSISSTQPKVAP